MMVALAFTGAALIAASAAARAASLCFPFALGAAMSLAAEGDARSATIALGQPDGVLPGFAGATEWINSPALTPEGLRGKVVLVDFWTFECYNCLNALPHVKNAFHNQYWPAAYYADATGKIRFYHFGEGRYDEQDKVVEKLLAERNANTTRGER